MRFALRSQRVVALGGCCEPPGEEAERRRHEGEELEVERRDCEE